MFDGVGASLYTQQVCNVLPMQKAKILRAERLDSKTDHLFSTNRETHSDLCCERGQSSEAGVEPCLCQLLQNLALLTRLYDGIHD